MKRLLPAVALTFAASASCMLDLTGVPGSGGAPATTAATGRGGEAATASGSTGEGGAGSAGGASSATGATSSSTGPTGPGWTRRRKLELDSGVGVALTNFSILVLLKKDRINYQETQDLGQDLRFTDDQNNALDHEIERWEDGGTSVVWVRIPSLKENTSSLPTIWMYYDNDKAADGQKVAGVWSDGYRGVWHLGESGDLFTDSSGFSPEKAENHGSTQSDGLFGKGRSFDAMAKQYIDTHNTEGLTKFTIEVLVRGDKAPATGNGPMGPLMRENNYQIMWDHTDPYSGTISYKPLFQVWTSADLKPLAAKTWYYLAASLDDTTLRTYKDGVHLNDLLANAPEYSPYAAKIGRHAALSDTKNFFTGDIDEVRIANKSRPNEWFVAQDRSMRDKLVKFGKEETAGGPWNVP